MASHNIEWMIIESLRITFELNHVQNLLSDVQTKKTRQKKQKKNQIIELACAYSFDCIEMTKQIHRWNERSREEKYSSINVKFNVHILSDTV